MLIQLLVDNSVLCDAIKLTPDLGFVMSTYPHHLLYLDGPCRASIIKSSSRSSKRQVELPSRVMSLQGFKLGRFDPDEANRPPEAAFTEAGDNAVLMVDVISMK